MRGPSPKKRINAESPGSAYLPPFRWQYRLKITAEQAVRPREFFVKYCEENHLGFRDAKAPGPAGPYRSIAYPSVRSGVYYLRLRPLFTLKKHEIEPHPLEPLPLHQKVQGQGGEVVGPGVEVRVTLQSAKL